MKNLKKLFLAGIIITIIACKPIDSQDGYAVQKPFDKELVPPTITKFSANEDFDLNLQTGTSIKIAKGTLVDENGELYQGQANLSFQEYHSNAEVIASGIPMRYDSAGNTGAFTTAGMFTINCTKSSGEDLFIAEGKNILVDVASNQKEKDYNYYKFVETKQPEVQSASIFAQVSTPRFSSVNESSNGSWQYLGRGKTRKNKKRQELEKALPVEPRKPGEPIVYDEAKFSFDIETDYKTYPELQPFEDVIWQYAGTEAKNDPEQNEWIFSEKNWSNISIKEIPGKGTYKLSFVGYNSSFSTEVYPVLSDEELVQAKADFANKMETYKSEIENRQQQVALMSVIGEVVRSFPISSFGSYNCDAVMFVMSTAQCKEATLTVANDKIKAEQFYVISSNGSRSTVVKYDESNLDKFFYMSQLENKIVATLSNNQVATLSPQQFELAAKNSNPKEFKADLKLSNSSIETLAQLDEVLSL